MLDAYLLVHYDLLLLIVLRTAALDLGHLSIYLLHRSELPVNLLLDFLELAGDGIAPLPESRKGVLPCGLRS